MSEPGTEQSGLLEDDRHGAVMSADREYRYQLTRTWDADGPLLAWVMLNPSTADETDDDPTIRRCVNFAQDWGYGAINVVNLFALRATDPSELREHPDPVGEDNDDHLRRVCEDADQVVAAWGANGGLQNRAREVARMLDVDLHALDTTKDGHPVHPLYQPADAEPEEWDERVLLAETDGGTDSTGSDRIRAAEEAGFPTGDLDSLLTEAEERYLANVEEHGEGKNWLNDEARWHIWKACDELFQARDPAHDGYDDAARSHMADALNHMLFALEITRHDREPFEDDDLRADGGTDQHGLTQGENDLFNPCELCGTPVYVHTPRVPVRSDVAAQLCKPCKEGLADTFGESNRSVGTDTDRAVADPLALLAWGFVLVVLAAGALLAGVGL